MRFGFKVQCANITLVQSIGSALFLLSVGFTKCSKVVQNKIKSSEVDVPEKGFKMEDGEMIENIKHPLENTWGFWLNTNENRKNWKENQKELTQFDTVEDYWCLFHHMKLPSELNQGQDYAIFKKGISPMWEDSANKRGGRWLINLDKRVAEMDRIWLDMVLLMIGENFEQSDIICGVVVNVRAKNRVSMWTKNKEKANMEIGRQLKEQLQVHFKLQFLAHNSNQVIYVV